MALLQEEMETKAVEAQAKLQSVEDSSRGEIERLGALVVAEQRQKARL
jgi:hypothetical protein